MLISKSQLVNLLNELIVSSVETYHRDKTEFSRGVMEGLKAFKNSIKENI